MKPLVKPHARTPNTSYNKAVWQTCSAQSTKTNSKEGADLKSTTPSSSSDGAPPTPVATYGSKSTETPSVSDFPPTSSALNRPPFATANTTPSPPPCGPIENSYAQS